MPGGEKRRDGVMPDHQTRNTRRPAPDPLSGASRTRRSDPTAGRELGAGPDRDPSRDGAAEPIDERESWASWPPRDIFAPFVLLAVSLQRAHGYVIEDYLRALGLFGITMSTLYRTLRQMEKDGFVESTWEPGPTGPARRVYTITDAGLTWLDSSATMLDAYRATIDRFFGLYGTGRAQPDGMSTQRNGEKETPR
jgi:PadR family transcriptional regulator PadR